MSSKLLDRKKRNHAEKILQKMSKKTGQSPGVKQSIPGSKPKSKSTTLTEQYSIIRNDLLKLRDDLSKGYDMAKGTIQKKGLISQLLKGK